MRHVLRDADDRDPRIVRTRQTERDAMPDRIFVGPVTRRQLLVNYGDRKRSGLHVRGREIAAFDERNAERLQVVCSDDLPTSRREVCRIEFPAFNRKWIAAAVATQRL